MMAIKLAGKLGLSLAEALELLVKLGLRLCGQRIILQRNGAIIAIPYSRKESETSWQLEMKSDENF